MKRLGGLGSTKQAHHAGAVTAVRAISRHAADVVSEVNKGRCTVAQMAYADMQREIGRYTAHRDSGGSSAKNTVYLPSTDIQEAALAFSDRCVRVSGHDPHALDGRRRKRR